MLSSGQFPRHLCADAMELPRRKHTTTVYKTTSQKTKHKLTFTLLVYIPDTFHRYCKMLKVIDYMHGAVYDF